jgi:hypothetical protein
MGGQRLFKGSQYTVLRRKFSSQLGEEMWKRKIKNTLFYFLPGANFSLKESVL